MMRKRKKFDNIKTGWILGTISPLIILVVVYFVKYSEIPFQTFIISMWEMKVFMKLLSLCVFPNLALFMFFNHQKLDMSSRGVILATFIYAFIVLVVKIM